MTINTKLEFDGAAPNNNRLQQVLDQLAAAIAQLQVTAGAAGGPDTAIQFNDGGIIAGNAAFAFDKTGLTPGSFNSVLSFTPTCSDFSGNVFNGDITNNATTANLDNPSGWSFASEFGGTKTITATSGPAIGTQYYAFANNSVTVNTYANLYTKTVLTGTSVVGTSADVWVSNTQIAGSPTLTNRQAIYVDRQTIGTNIYAFWYDGPAVFRVKEDATLNATVGLYNPGFAKYTPGASNFERGILGQWAGNVFQITTEKGGTGTLRGMQIGASTSVPLGFYGKTPIACAVLATGAAHTVDDVITALQNLGLVKQS